MDMSLSKLWEMVKDRKAWRAAAHGVAKNRTRLRDWTTTTINIAGLGWGRFSNWFELGDAFSNICPRICLFPDQSSLHQTKTFFSSKELWSAFKIKVIFSTIIIAHAMSINVFRSFWKINGKRMREWRREEMAVSIVTSLLWPIDVFSGTVIHSGSHSLDCHP